MRIPDTRPLRRRPSSLLPIVFITAVGFALAVPALAQNPAPASASVSTCNLKGQVTLSVFGVPVTYPLACVNPTEQSAPGSDSSELVGTTTLGVPAVANLASVAAPYGDSQWLAAADTLTLIGEAGATDVGLL